MIPVIAHLVDFMDTTPISNAEVTLTVQAIADLIGWIDARKPNNFLHLHSLSPPEAPEKQPKHRIHQTECYPLASRSVICRW
jgi:hypothetical protein